MPDPVAAPPADSNRRSSDVLLITGAAGQLGPAVAGHRREPAGDQQPGAPAAGPGQVGEHAGGLGDPGDDGVGGGVVAAEGELDHPVARRHPGEALEHVG